MIVTFLVIRNAIVTAGFRCPPLKDAEMKTRVAILQPKDVAIVRTLEFERKQSSGAATAPEAPAAWLVESGEWQPKTTVPVATNMNALVHTNSTIHAFKSDNVFFSHGGHAIPICGCWPFGMNDMPFLMFDCF